MNDLRKAAQQALEALENLDGIDTESECVTIDVANEITALRAALVAEEARHHVPAPPEMQAAIDAALAQSDVPDGLPLVIAGAIYDFAAYLITRPEVIEVGSTANSGPIVDLLKEWAKLRGLSLDDPAILSWQEWLPKAPKGGA